LSDINIRVSALRLNSSLYSFKQIAVENLRKVTSNLDSKSQLPFHVLKENDDHLCQHINNFLISVFFPKSQKLANVTPTLKKGDLFLKENYRPI